MTTLNCAGSPAVAAQEHLPDAMLHSKVSESSGEVAAVDTVARSPAEAPLAHTVEKSSFRMGEAKGRGPSDLTGPHEGNPYRPFRVEQVCNIRGRVINMKHTSDLDSSFEASFRLEILKFSSSRITSSNDAKDLQKIGVW